MALLGGMAGAEVGTGGGGYFGRMAGADGGRGASIAERAGWLEWLDSAPIYAIKEVEDGKHSACWHF